MGQHGSILSVSGPVVRAHALGPVRMFEVARVGREELIGEVVRLQNDVVDIQVYEETMGLRTGEPVWFSGDLLSVELGPGLLGSVLDGIGRPLVPLGRGSIFIPRGAQVATLDRETAWPFSPAVTPGASVAPGSILGYVVEGAEFPHAVMVPPGSRGGTVATVASAGAIHQDEPLCTTREGERYTLSHFWPVRQPRPVRRYLPLERPLETGQRILDMLFPLALGGAGVIPGGFGTGKTVTQQSLARWCNADVIVYIGCGERGNEMTEVLEEFPELMDPRTGRPLMERVVLVANTSNMPVAAREASIYLGMSIAEYFRDMGRHVAIMADSLSRWAEALREIGGRLEEMPGEEGYPAYLPSRLSQYFERSGRVVTLGEPEREGSVTVISAVSPPGGDFSEPVTQSCLRLSGAFWGLDKNLAQQRHFPAINWRSSYTLYENSLAPHFLKTLGSDWEEKRRFLRTTLDREKELLELVQLVGREGLSEEDKWLLELAELLRIVFLQQNAFDPVDAFTSPLKAKRLLDLFYDLDRCVSAHLRKGLVVDQIPRTFLREALFRLRALGEEELFREGKLLWQSFGAQLASEEVVPV